jgi:hypothetical protein
VTDPLPVVIPDELLQPLPDLSHERIRLLVLEALQVVWGQHQELAAQLTTAQADITALQAQVAALTPPPLP